MLATQEVDFEAARRALDRALVLAPTYVDALEYLGMLLLEADQREAGLEKLNLVLELEPIRFNPLLHMGRLRALDGDFDGATSLFERAESSGFTPRTWNGSARRMNAVHESNDDIACARWAPLG